MPQPPASDGWRAKLGDTVAAAEGRTTLGLLFQLRTLTRDGSQWVAPKGQPATEVLAHRAQRLAVRPVRLTETGNWVAKDVAWSTVAHRTASLGLDPRQVDWFAQFQGLHRLAGDGYRASEPDWLTLDDFASPLLWPLLRGAVDRGIGLVSGRRAERVSLHTAEVTAEVATDGSTGAIRLRPRVRLAEHAAPGADDGDHNDDDPDDTRIVRPTGSIGGHGIYVCDFDDGLRVRLASVRAADLEVVGWGTGGVRIPSHEVSEFWRDYYPGLAHRVPLVGRGVALPDVRDDTVLVVEHLPGDVIETRWERWRGAAHVLLVDAPIDVPPRLRGADAAAFVSDDLVRIAAQGVRVVHVGDRPDYRERTDVPALEFTAVPGESNDWLDLGFVVTVGAYVVPFADLFSALSRGRTKLLLVDKSWLSLDHPVFDALRDLIAEGEQLAEWETGAVVSRYRATLFEPFEDTSDSSPAAVAWRVAAAALSGPPAALAQPDGLRADLRPYQLDGFRRLAHLREHRLGGILADDMGLGKTVQTIALLVHAAGSGPALVVAPTSVVGAWADELTRFAPTLAVTAITDTRMPIPTDGDVIVTSYAVLRLRAEAFAARAFDTVVLDEAQMLKNPAAQVHEAALALRARVKIALTGTPLENSLMDLWSLLRIVSPGLFPSRIRFSDRYVKAHAEVRIAELRRRIRPLLLRRTKREVAAELPPKQEQVVSLDLSPAHRDLYDRHLQRERQKMLGLVDDIDRSRFILFRSLTLLRMLALDPRLVDPEARVDGSSKIDELADRLEALAAEGRRALVFSQFTSALALVRQALDARGIRYEQLDGSTTRRPEVIERFRSGDAPAFLISLRAGGVGLTLTEADTVFLLDPWWNPAAELQAIDRTHRIGQTQPVMVYRLVAKDTVEEKVVALAEDKQALFDEVFGGGELSTAALSTDELRALLD